MFPTLKNTSKSVAIYAWVFLFGPFAVSALAEEPIKTIEIPASAEGWRNAAQTDIKAAYQELLNNHPGVYDPSNPAFRDLLSKAQSTGLELAAKVTNPAGYVATFERFSAILNDGHAGAYPKLDDKTLPQVQWPGFITVWRGQGLLVYASEPGGPAVESEVVSCDGQPIKTLIERNVFDYRGRANIDGMWWVHARKVFYDTGNPFISRPKVCTFRHEGRMSEIVLSYRATNQNFDTWRNESYNGDELPIGVSEPSPGLKWIALPNFQPDDAGVNAYHAMFNSIANNRADYLKADAIVLDLRQNQGGSSEWPELAASALWGKDRLERRLGAYFSKVEIWWRANAETADHVRSIVKSLREQKLEGTASAFAPIASGIESAAKAGNPFYVDRTPPETPMRDPSLDLPTDPPALTRPVYVIVPGQCASACNDAIDMFTRFSNVKLVGAPSSNDSYYMEVRVKRVPSGLAQVVLPTKIWVGRPRGPNDFYKPNLAVTSMDWSTQTFMKVILDDLKQSKP